MGMGVIGKNSAKKSHLLTESIVSSQQFNSREDPLVTSVEEELPRMAGYLRSYFFSDLPCVDKEIGSACPNG
jgi:hypothetical protein